jgi:iron(III) transport system substrate-binding protein
MIKQIHFLILFLGCAITSLLPVHAADPETLVIYSGRSDKFVKPVIEAFTRDTGVKVILHSAKSTELINKLRIEGARTDADLFISNDAGNLQVGSDFKLFSPISDSLIKGIDSQYRAPDSTWVGLSARARVLVVNTNKADEIDFVKSVMDLADPRLNGKLAITHSANGSFIAGVTVYQEVLGDDVVLEWLKGMKKNSKGKVYNKHSKVVNDVAAGKKAVGLVNHYYIYRHLAKDPDAPIKILMPDQGEKAMGIAWNVAGIAIVKHSGKKVLAEKLIAYLVSEKGQYAFANENSEYPTRKGVDAAAVVPAAGSYKVANVPMSELGRKRTQTLDLIEKAGMN